MSHNIFIAVVNTNLFNVISDEYIKVYHSNCLSGQGFGTLPEAKYACSSIENCVGILDELCKEDFEYYLCLDFYEEDQDKSSCIYKKKDKKGTYIYDILKNISIILYSSIDYFSNSIKH